MREEFRFSTKESVLNKLTEVTSGTDKVFYSEDELSRFADHILSLNRSLDVEDLIFELTHVFCYEVQKETRRCTVCGKLFSAGYVLYAGEEYFCSDDCLHTRFTDEEWAEIYREDDESYYTEF